MSDPTSGWNLYAIGLEGDHIFIGGLNPWQHEWHSVKEPPITVAHPSYADQRHTMWIYELRANGETVKFAAGEFSNGVWGFFVPEARS